MKTGLIVCILFGLAPYYLSAQDNTTAERDAEEHTPTEEKNSRFIELIELTIAHAQSQAQRKNRSVILYSEAGFCGEYRALNNDWSARHAQDYWNDRIGSIEVPQGAEVWLYEHANFKGRTLVVSGDWSIHDHPWWRHRISAVRLVTFDQHAYPQRGRDHSREHDHHAHDRRESGVTLYKKKDLSGAALTIYGDWSVRHRYDFWNDCISAIHIPPGYEVIIYKHANFQGRSKSLVGPWPRRRHGDFWDDWDNEISSIEIIRR